MVAAILSGRRSYQGYRVYHILPTKDQIHQLDQFQDQPGYDFWTTSHKVGHSCNIMVSPQELQNFEGFLNMNNVTYLVRDAQTILESERTKQISARVTKPSKRFSFNKYHRYSKINKFLSKLASNYPNLVSLKCLGNSFEGRKINMVKISSGGNGSHPGILVNAGMHAREWIAPAMALYIIDQLVENCTNRVLTSSVDWHIIPVLNVDGYEYSHSKDRLWRKTRSITSNASCPGVDGNRNFDFHWNENGTSDDPCSTNYAGQDAFSESETVAFRDYVLTNANTIKLYLDLHSAGNQIMYPWGYTDTSVDNWEELNALAHDANAAQMAAGGDSYEIGSSICVLYPASGTSGDWVKGVANISVSYTVELPGGGGLHEWDLPASHIHSTVSQFFEAVRVFGSYVANDCKRFQPSHEQQKPTELSTTTTISTSTTKRR